VIRAPIAAPMRALFAALVIAGAAIAQDTIHFDPSRDLEGFETAVASDHPELYPIRRYRAMRDREMTPDELAKVKEEWKKDCDAAAKRMQMILDDPRELYFYGLERQLYTHPFFSKIEYDVDRSIEDFFFLVERPKSGSNFTQDPHRVAAFYGPALLRMRDAFQKDFAEPLRILRRADYAAYAICLLLDKAEYHAFGETSEERWSLTEAYYDPKLALIVAYGDPAAPDTTPAKQRRRVLAEFARALEHAHYTGRSDRPKSLWLNLGFASWFAWREGELADANDKTAPDPEALEDLVKKAQDKKSRDVLLHSVLDLVQVTATNDIELLAKNRAEATRNAPPKTEDALRAFYDQAFLWMRFLQDGADGRYRDMFRKYFVNALGGRGGLDEFEMDFRGADLKKLDREFYADLLAQHEKLFPNTKVDKSFLETLFADRAVPTAIASSAPDPSKGPSKEPTKGSSKSSTPTASSSLPALPIAPYAAAALAVQPTDVDGQHGLALLQVVHGDLDGAILSLEKLATPAAGTPEEASIRKDLERAKEFRQLRDGYFDYLVKSGEKISGKYRGMEYVATVQKVEDGWIHLGDNGSGLSKMPVSALEAFEIARQAGRPEEQGTAAPWVRFWPYVLVGEKKWEQLLKDESPGAKSLREDAAKVYPEILKCAGAATALNEIAATPEPKSAKESEKLITAIQNLITSSGELPLVQRKRETLRRVAGGAILATYVPQEPSKLCHGVWTGGSTGKVTVVYDFNKPEEAKDWIKVPGYLDSFHKGLAATAKKEADSSWTVIGGEFTGAGSACYRNYLLFEAPVTVRYDLVFRPSSSKNPEAFTFFVAACDNGEEDYTACLNFGDLQVVDKKSGILKTLADEKPAQSKKVQKLELRNDGTNVSTWLGGQKHFETPCGKRTSGSVVMWFHTDNTVAIQKIEIEGKLDPSWAVRAKAAYYETKLAEIGFK
jgi:hypothetical protein